MKTEDNPFLKEDFQVEIPGKYLKLTPGEYTIRIMGSPISGYENWDAQENKPVRWKTNEDPPSNMRFKNAAHSVFWAMVVWNYATKSLQVFSTAKKSVQDGIKKWAANDKWGDPRGYDLVISRTGSGKNDTRYDVMPEPKTETPEEAVEAFAKCDIDLNALYTGDDPFGDSEKEDDNPF